jgi:hypothetical protein
MMDNTIPHVTMTSEAAWNPRVVDDTETAEELMQQFPPTSIEDTDLFYNNHGDIDDDYVRKNYQTSMIEPNSVRWKPVLTETNDGEPFIPQHKQLEMTGGLAPASVKTQPTDKNENSEQQFSEPISTDTNENFADSHPLNTGTIIEKNECL